MATAGSARTCSRACRVTLALGLLRSLLGVPLALDTLDPGARAQETTSNETNVTWEALPITVAVDHVFTLASGPVFAWSSDGPDPGMPGSPTDPPSPRLLRSDDGGTSWSPIALPPPPRRSGAVRRPIAAVDPLDPNVLYAAGQEGLYRSDDGGDTWRGLLATPARIVGVAASPAERGLVYLVIADDPTLRARFLRSHDAGASWEERSSERIIPDRFALGLLLPHPADPRAVLATYTAGTVGMIVKQSTDQGATWQEIRLCPPPAPSPPALCDYRNVNRLAVAGSGTAARLYLTTMWDRQSRRRGVLWRSDDGGLSWAAMLDFQSTTPSVTLAALALEAGDPERLYVALGDGWSGVLVSADGGATWLALASPAEATIRELAVSGDGASLYAATDRGL
jgi:photosystem II stability/assembly factor-like uncharacterized protein